MESLKIVVGVPNACCRDPENIDLIETTNPLIIIRRCRVCGCNHYLMMIEPGSMTTRGMDIG